MIRHMAEDYIRFRVVRSGDRVELIEYDSPVKCGVERGFVQKKKSKEELDGTEEKREDNLYRARQAIRRIIWSNLGKYTKFLTLTYKITCLDVSKVRNDLATFFKGMKRAGYNLKYLYVLEHQKERGEKEGNEGSLHVHIVLFHDAYIPWQTIKRYWKHGSIDIHPLRSVKNVGAYVCKYITKENLADFGSHTYACSKGLKRPKDSCFYTSGDSDCFGDNWTLSEIKAALNSTFSSVSTFDIIARNGGEPIMINQTVRYTQGEFDGNSRIAKRFQLTDVMDTFEWSEIDD